MQDNRVYDFDILEFPHGKMNLNCFLNLEKIEKFLDIHCKHKYEKHCIGQMHIISNGLCMDHEILLHIQSQLNVLHILFLSNVSRNDSVE